MSFWETLLLSVITSFFTAVFIINYRINYYRFLYGPRKKSKGNIGIRKVETSDKVYVVNFKRKTKRWVHPGDSLDKLGYNFREDGKTVKSLDEYTEKTDINLTF